MTLTPRGRVVATILTIAAVVALAWASVHVGTRCYTETIWGLS